MDIEYINNVYLCISQEDARFNQAEYAHSAHYKHQDVKVVGNKVIVNGKWNVLFVWQEKGLDGLYINEITVSTALSTAGDVRKITNMINTARQGRIAMKNLDEEIIY